MFTISHFLGKYMIKSDLFLPNYSNLLTLSCGATAFKKRKKKRIKKGQVQSSEKSGMSETRDSRIVPHSDSDNWSPVTAQGCHQRQQKKADPHNVLSATQNFCLIERTVEI